MIVCYGSVWFNFFNTMQTDCLGKVSQILYFNVEWDTVFMALPPNGFSDGIMLRPVTLWTTVKYKL